MFAEDGFIFTFVVGGIIYALGWFGLALCAVLISVLVEYIRDQAVAEYKNGGKKPKLNNG
jgi:hypothetical protein